MEDNERVIEDHILDVTLGRDIQVTAINKPGHGGANHVYNIKYNDDVPATIIPFQDGPVGEVGTNGVTETALLAIVIDRLRSFQNGEYRSRENACAITHIEEALMWLHRRTTLRQRRGVEGTSQT